MIATRSRVDLTIRPKSISQSPVRNQAVVVGTDTTGDDAVLVIALPTAEPTPTPAPTPTASATSHAPPVTRRHPTVEHRAEPGTQRDAGPTAGQRDTGASTDREPPRADRSPP